MRWNAVRQLRSLRRFPVPPEALVSGRLRLVARIEAAPMLQRPSVWFMAAAWRPVMASIIVAVVATGGGTVVAAHDALPGEALYVVKLAAEDVRERAALTAEGRFAIQAAHASQRLDETEVLLERQGISETQRETLVRKAMDRYEDHLFVMNEIAVKMEIDPKKPFEGKHARQAAENVSDRHLRLVESATHADAVLASIMLEPIEATFSLEDDLPEAISADDGGKDESDSDRRREREERIGGSLKRVRASIEDRRVRDKSSRRQDERRSDDDEERDR